MRKEESASSWGCELKFYTIAAYPSCILSASSWGCELKCRIHGTCFDDFLSASSWGCELKYFVGHGCKCNIDVSLFMRLWVEIFARSIIYFASPGQPLHEAVSWNVTRFERNWQHLRSASSWGCELKSQGINKRPIDKMSASSWGCELKWSW